jgi:tRNA U38,U39,U40 pseudouridine synthase TruA
MGTASCKMVRFMTGTIVGCSLGKMSVIEVRARLRGAAPKKEARRLAPAAGLTLVRVRY